VLSWYKQCWVGRAAVSGVSSAVRGEQCWLGVSSAVLVQAVLARASSSVSD